MKKNNCLLALVDIHPWMSWIKSEQPSPGFPSGSDGKEFACNAEDLGSIPESGRSPGDGNGNPLHFLPVKSPGQRNMMGFSPWGNKESDTIEWLTLSFHSVQTFFWLVAGKVTGWCSRTLMLSLKSLSTWVGVLVPAEELKDTLLCIFIEEKPGPWFMDALLFLDWLLFCFCILSLPFLATCWICPLELREGLRGLNEAYFLQKRKGGDGKYFYLGRPQQSPVQLYIHIILYNII